MAGDSKGGTAAQGATTPQPEAGTSSSSQGEAAPAVQGTGAAAASGTSADSQLLSKIAELEKDNADYRKRERERTEADKKREREGMGEAEKLTARLADLEQQNADLVKQDRERSVRLAAVEAAGKLGFRNPELAFRLLDRAAIEYREDGSPKNVEKLLRDVLETDAYLGKPNGGPDYGGGPRGSPPDSTPDMNTLLRRAARG